MTTVACDGSMMASDGLITTGDSVVATSHQKIFKLNDGRVIGFSGDAYGWDTIIDYLNDPTGKTWPDTSKVAIMVLELDRTITMYDKDGRTFKRPSPTAIGTGFQYAIGAMDSGMSALAAVAVATKRDVLSGGTMFAIVDGELAQFDV